MINNLIQGYALGCLNQDEIKQLREAVDSADPQINLKDLGKFQNLAALLPSGLPLEIPDQKVKEKIARKLYRINNENGSKKEVLTGDLDGPVITKDISKEIINRTRTAGSTAERYRRITAQSPPMVGENRRSKENDLNLVSGYRSIRITRLALYLSAALFLGLVIGFFLFYENSNVYKDEINRLSADVQDLNNELITNAGVLTLLEKKDTRIFPLSGSEIYPDGYGKVYFNPSSKRAYLYLSGVEPLKEGTYQLWVVTYGSSYSVGLFNPKKTPGYFYFSFPDLRINSNISILLTEEPEGGSPKPGRRVHLRTQD